MPEETVDQLSAPAPTVEANAAPSEATPEAAPAKPKRRAPAKKAAADATVAPTTRTRRKAAPDEAVQAPLPIDATPAVLSSFSPEPVTKSDAPVTAPTPVEARDLAPRRPEARAEVVQPQAAPREETVREEAPQNSAPPQIASTNDAREDARAPETRVENVRVDEARDNASQNDAPREVAPTSEAANDAPQNALVEQNGVANAPQVGEGQASDNGDAPYDANGQGDNRFRFRGRENRALRPGRTFGRNGEERPDNRGENRQPENRQPEGRDNRQPENREQRGDNRNDNRDNRNRDENRNRDNRSEQNGSNPQRDNRNENRDGRDNRDNRNERRNRDGRDGRDNRDNRDRDNRDRNRGDNGEYQPRKPDYDLATMETKTLDELRDIAREVGMEPSPSLSKPDLSYAILDAQAEAAGNLIKRGIIEIQNDGKGFLRCSGYLAAEGDVYVSQSQVKRFNLRTGDMVMGLVRAPKEMERYHGLLRVEAINGESPEAMRSRKEFEKLTPIFPTEKFKLEIDQGNITARIIDLVSPVGKGQRGLIVAPPKAGKTTLLKNIANSIALNHPEVMLMVLLIDERPEEVTDISRSVKGEVVASTFDEMPENHMRVAELVFEKAKRLVEQGKDVVILLDSITRLSRASNLVVTPSGRTLSGGLDPAAMYRPKRMFGAARNIEEGGSLTILATTLVDTGSRMDEMIFEEFKGTGNLDLVLDRDLFNQRVFPAIDINKSGTRRDDLLLSKDDLAATFHLRRTLAALDNDKAIQLLIDRLKNTRTNADFMTVVQKSMRASQSGAISGG